MRGLRLACGLFPDLRVAAGTHDDARALEAQALPHEGIQELAIVGNEQPDTPIARKRPENGPAREDIHVVGRLVHNEHVRILPKRHSNLQTLLLATRKRVVAPGPVIVDTQIDAQAHGALLPRARKILEPVGRNGRILLAIRNDQATRRYRTAIRR